MSTYKYYLRLTNNELQWSTDQANWRKVTSDSPMTGLNEGDEMEWDSDDESIKWMKIKFEKGNIIPNGNVSGNQSKKVRGNTKSGLSGRLSDTYTITVKPSGGGAPGEFDPGITYPDD